MSSNDRFEAIVLGRHAGLHRNDPQKFEECILAPLTDKIDAWGWDADVQPNLLDGDDTERLEALLDALEQLSDDPEQPQFFFCMAAGDTICREMEGELPVELEQRFNALFDQSLANVINNHQRDNGSIEAYLDKAEADLETVSGWADDGEHRHVALNMGSIMAMLAIIEDIDGPNERIDAIRSGPCADILARVDLPIDPNKYVPTESIFGNTKAVLKDWHDGREHQAGFGLGMLNQCIYMNIQEMPSLNALVEGYMEDYLHPELDDDGADV